MSKRFAEIVILAEDERSANFLRKYVERALHLKNRRIRQVISPSAQGDAKNWVLHRYPVEIKLLRRMHRHTGLVVHLDADTDSVTERARQLAAVLKDDGQNEREAAERIVHVIPRRNTETWLCALTGLNVDEEQDCKRQRLLPDFDGVVGKAALELYELTRANASPSPLPSLAEAVLELRRLEH